LGLADAALQESFACSGVDVLDPVVTFALHVAKAEGKWRRIGFPRDIPIGLHTRHLCMRCATTVSPELLRFCRSGWQLEWPPDLENKAMMSRFRVRGSARRTRYALQSAPAWPRHARPLVQDARLYLRANFHSGSARVDPSSSARGRRSC